MIAAFVLAELLQRVLQWDTSLFYLVNQDTQNRLFDMIMPLLSDFDLWRWPVLALALVTVLLGNRYARITVLLAVVTVVLSDQISSSVLKPLIGRLRPSHALEGVRLLAGRGGRLAFPSSHAANITAAWSILALRHRRWSLFLAVIPLGVSYSRVYLGVHYPLDVLGGAFLGWLLALTVASLERMISRRIRQRGKQGRKGSPSER
jgi:undecaprenyl-diphosphatase